MRTMKFSKQGNRVQLIMRTNEGYFGIYFPVKKTEEYFEIVPITQTAQELLEQCN